MSESEPVKPVFSTRPRLPLLLLWGLSPGFAMTLAGLCMEFRVAELGTLFLFVGIVGGPIVLLIWSLRIMWLTEWKTADKVLIAIPMAAGACAVNLFLAAGACSLFDPPLLD